MVDVQGSKKASLCPWGIYAQRGGRVDLLIGLRTISADSWRRKNGGKGWARFLLIAGHEHAENHSLGG